MTERKLTAEEWLFRQREPKFNEAPWVTLLDAQRALSLAREEERKRFKDSLKVPSLEYTKELLSDAKEEVAKEIIAQLKEDFDNNDWGDLGDYKMEVLASIAQLEKKWVKKE